jgi:anti-sigma factor RsiW
MSDRPAPHLSDELLNEYLDEALTPEARALAEAHLGACATCAGRLEALRALFAGLEALPEVELARDLAPAVGGAVRRQAALPVPTRRAWLPWALAVQALAALGALALAWPFLAARLGSLPGLAAPVTAFARDLLAALQASARTLAAPGDPFEQLMALVPANWPLAWPEAAAWVPLQAALAVAAGAGLLWLFTNLWLLGHRPSGHPRRS